MPAEHAVIYGEGAQTLYHVPRDLLAAPTVATAPTYAIVDLDEGEDSANRFIVAAGTAATPVAVSQTTQSAAGATEANPRRIEVTDASAYTPGRHYLMLDVGDRREMVTVDSVDTSSNYVYCVRPLRRDYATGSTLRGFELQATFPESAANDESETVEDDNGRYAVIWTYTANGAQRNAVEQVRVYRYSMMPWVTEADILQGHTKMNIQVDEQLVRDAIIVSTEQIAAELEMSGLLPQNYKRTGWGKVMARNLALSIIFENMGSEQDLELSTRYHDRYSSMMMNLKTGSAPKHTTVIDEDDNTKRHGAERIRSRFKRP